MNGKNIILYGSRSVALALMRWNLVDEYNLWVHPVVLGKGKPLFNELNNALQLKLMSTVTFNTGVVLSRYRVKLNTIEGLQDQQDLLTRQPILKGCLKIKLMVDRLLYKFSNAGLLDNYF